MGATLAVDAHHENLKDVQKRLGMKEGFDVGLEMSGAPQGLRSLLENMRNGSNVALLGILSKETAINWDDVVFKGLTIKGIYGRLMYETWYKMNALVLNGLDITPVITHRFHYSEYEKAFKVMNSRQSGKVILNWVDE